jgi:hypothetical protein
VRFNASGDEISGLGAPFGTPSATPDLARSTRLPASALPALIWASMAGPAMMIMS